MVMYAVEGNFGNLLGPHQSPVTPQFASPVTIFLLIGPRELSIDKAGKPATANSMVATLYHYKCSSGPTHRTPYHGEFTSSRQ